MNMNSREAGPTRFFSSITCRFIQEAYGELDYYRKTYHKCKLCGSVFLWTLDRVRDHTTRHALLLRPAYIYSIDGLYVAKLDLHESAKIVPNLYQDLQIRVRILNTDLNHKFRKIFDVIADVKGCKLKFFTGLFLAIKGKIDAHF